MAQLYMVATPIGNLEDITIRALNILKEVDVIACEDTRQTMILLNHYEIKKRLISCRAANEKESAAGIVKLMEKGDDIAYVSDAGTPGISDPGKQLVRKVRESGFKVVPIPGASAFGAMVSVSGFPDKSVLFEGFLSPKGGKRRKRVEELLSRNEAFILYESPYRILKLLNDIKEAAPERKLLLGREISKKFEEFIEGTADQLFANLEKRANIKGELALLVTGSQKV